MQRYHAGNCSSAVNNSGFGGVSAIDTNRQNLSSFQEIYPVNSRCQLQLTPYNLKCDKEPLNSRLGPPDFHPPTANCPEETLTKEYVQAGYKETVEGVEDAKELLFSQAGTFTRPVVFKCKEAIRKQLRAINESRTRKRKAGQVYEVPLSGPLLSKPGIFPEQKAVGEDSRKRWIEALSQHQKSLQALADHVPNGYRKRSLFEVLIKNDVPVLRATWFIKITYLNLIPPGSSRISSETRDESQLSRAELWTKDITEYLQYLLDEYLSRNPHATPQNRVRSPQMPFYSGSSQQKHDAASVGFTDGEEPSLHFKWWYVVRILHWHNSEGLIHPSVLIDWIVLQLQETDLVQVFQLLLPVIYGVSETIILCQTYVWKLVDAAVRFLRQPPSGGSDLVDNSRRAYTTSALVEMLRYLILSVPDTFVGLDCFPLPRAVVTLTVDEGSCLSKLLMDDESQNSGVNMTRTLGSQYQSSCFNLVVSSIQKRAAYLEKVANHGYLGQNGAKAIQALNSALIHGDIREAYKCLFKDVCYAGSDDCWFEAVSPSLRPCLKYIDSVNFSLICSVFIICEWCTCDYSNFRIAPGHDLKFTGRKDFSQIHVAVRLLKARMQSWQKLLRIKNENSAAILGSGKGPGQLVNLSERTLKRSLYGSRHSQKVAAGSVTELSDFFESPNPFHDAVVCWIDQHEAKKKGEGLKRIQLLLVELICSGIFYPQAYVRQLLVSGVMDRNVSVGCTDKQKRHSWILKQLPPAFIRATLEEAWTVEVPLLFESLHVYRNERRLLLCVPFSDETTTLNSNITPDPKLIKFPFYAGDSSLSAVDVLKTLQPCSSLVSRKSSHHDGAVEDVKAAISDLLQLPEVPIYSALIADEPESNVKRPASLKSYNMNIGDGLLGCEECKKTKRQKLSEERSLVIQGSSANQSDDEDSWWSRKDPKPVELMRSDPPAKPLRQPSKGRQKTVRKTQSLAQLAGARIEGSQGASTSHVCDNHAVCPHHRTGLDREASKPVDLVKRTHFGDIISIGRVLKRKRFIERRSIHIWLTTTVKHLVGVCEKAAKTEQLIRIPSSADERSSIQWKLGEDELSVILYLMDISDELSSAIRFLMWLLPKAVGGANVPIHGGRNMMMVRNLEGHAIEVGEPFLLSCIRRYENILVSADLIPEMLSSAMQRAASVIISNGRLSCSPTFLYARYLLKRYGSISSVAEWEKSARATLDQRLMSELESDGLQNGEFGFPLGIASCTEDPDDFIRHKISGNRLSRAGMSMRDIVAKYVDDMLHHLFGKERKLFAAGAQKSAGMEKWDDGYQIAQQIVIGLLDCIRQTGGAAQEGDPSLVSSAVSAIVGNVGPALARMPDFTSVSNHSSLPSPTGSLSFARRVLRVHLNCLCLLKEALGERHSRTFEIALAAEASSALAGVFTTGKAHDSNSSLSNDAANNSTKVVIGRATKIAAAVSALVVGAVIHGVAALERLVRVLRLKEGLDVMKYVRSIRSHTNGSAQPLGAQKVDNSIEVYVHWFRLLIGNSRSVSDGLVVELLGEPSIVALARMQRTLPLDVILPPAYSIFAFLIWRDYIFSNKIMGHEDTHPLFHSMVSAVGDAIKHMPFRDVCLRDTQGFYDYVSSDPTESEFAAVLEKNGSSDKLFKALFASTRARLFLNAVVDCKLLYSVQNSSDHVYRLNDLKIQHQEGQKKISEKLVHALDTLQCAKFHWQWVEIRLLLNEQELHSCLSESVVDAIRFLSPSHEKKNASDSENNFIEIVLTRLLVRPDATHLFSEVLHLCGRQTEVAMLVLAKWFLAGQDVLYGRKSIRHRLLNIAESKGFSTKVQFGKSWGWCSEDFENSKIDRNFESKNHEDSNVRRVGSGLKRKGREPSQMSDSIRFKSCQLLGTEKALIALLLPCLDRSPDEARNVLAGDLIKQMHHIELYINAVTGGTARQGSMSPPGTESSTGKVTNRKSSKGGSLGLARRLAAVPSTDNFAPSSPSTLRASLSLRLLLLLRLLPYICTEGEAAKTTLRSTLAMTILRLLGSRVVYEDVEMSFRSGGASPSKGQNDLEKDASSSVHMDLSGRYIFDWLLLVLHALLSPSRPCWLKAKPTSRQLPSEHIKYTSGVDRETLDMLQNNLGRLQIPEHIRHRIQAAMPIFFPSCPTYTSCHNASVSSSALTSLQPIVSSWPTPHSFQSNHTSKNSTSSTGATAANNMPGGAKQKSMGSQPDHCQMDIDPWNLLEEGAGSSPSLGNMLGSDLSILKASSLLKGAVRVRRRDLTYIGSMDDDS